jgi:gamma-glutamyl:cysteine ligase YbdK (ATP-grasp superfamily)
MREDEVWLTPDERYRRIADHFRALLGTVNVCGCHIHVGVPDRQTACRSSTNCGLGCPCCSRSARTPPW